MAKIIGDTFAEELLAAGLGGLPFAWGEDGAIEYGEAITPEQKAAIEAVVAAHDPTIVKDPKTERKNRVMGANTLAELKVVLADLL